MAREDKIWEYVREAGYQPLEKRCIIVKPAPDNLSEKIVSFLKTMIECEFCALQMCEHELIMLPFDSMWTYLKKEASLVLPYKEIQSVTLEDDLLNTMIVIHTEDDEIRLTTQQKALSDLRVSSLYATQFAGGYKNWHKENIDDTLKALTALGNGAK